MKASFFKTLATTILFVAQIGIPMAHAQTSTMQALPNGASSLNEIYQDWTVNCASNQNALHCALSQQQRKQDTNQLVLAIEFGDISAQNIAGTLVLPFGLKLADGVSIQVDDEPAWDVLPFATCLPVGCTVSLAFDQDKITALRNGAILNLTTKAIETQKPVLFTVSLKGFSAAQDRGTQVRGAQ